MRIVLGEYLLLGIAAGIAGIIITVIVTRVLAPELSGIGTVLLVGFASLIVLGLGASIPPARRAANIDPVHSMNSF